MSLWDECTCLQRHRIEIIFSSCDNEHVTCKVCSQKHRTEITHSKWAHVMWWMCTRDGGTWLVRIYLIMLKMHVVQMNVFETSMVLETTSWRPTRGPAKVQYFKFWWDIVVFKCIFMFSPRGPWGGGRKQPAGAENPATPLGGKARYRSVLNAPSGFK